MPERLFQAVRAYFRAPPVAAALRRARPRSWSRSCSTAGVSRFVFMPYAHRGEMSRSLNHWVANVQATFAPDGIGFGTFHPDDDELVPELVDEAFGRLGLRGAKLHPQVGRFAHGRSAAGPAVRARGGARRVAADSRGATARAERARRRARICAPDATLSEAAR